MSECDQFWVPHVWTKWVDTEKFHVAGGRAPVGYGIHQERRCVLCNKVELRTTKTTLK